MIDALIIPLSKGLQTIVDADCAWLLQWAWHVSGYHSKTGLRYAQRTSRLDEGKPRRLIYMHREILAAPHGIKVDHRDHDGLHNRRSNLRLCEHTQNIANARRPVGIAGYRGVTPTRHGRWAAQITTHGEKRRCIGHFPTAIAAAVAYDQEAYAAWGEFAVLNFPERIGQDESRS